jgi:hypothetical protein
MWRRRPPPERAGGSIHFDDAAPVGTTFGELVDKLAVPAIACEKCGRSGRYGVTMRAETIRSDGKVIH